MKRDAKTHGFLDKLPDPFTWSWISKFEKKAVPSLSHPRHRQWMRAHQEVHQSREIMLCLAGDHFYGYRGQVCKITPGTILLVDAEDPHDAVYAKHQPACRDLWFHLLSPAYFYVNDFTVATGKGNPSHNQVLYSMGHGKPFVESVHSAWNHCSEYPDSSFHLAQLKGAVISMVLEVVLHSSQFSQSREKINQQQLVVEQVKNHIVTHIGSDLSLAVLAERAGYDPVYFHRLFTKFTGEPIHQFINRYRVEAAQTMLKEGLKVVAIASSLGFGTSSYFCRFFKRETGLTPGTWVENIHSADDPEFSESD